MKPEAESRRVFAITRAKGKLYEFGVDESSHIKIPTNVAPSELLLLTVGILGDVAAAFHEGKEEQVRESSDVQFAASFFDALLASRLDEDLSSELKLLAAAAYYLADRPGSSLVLARRIDPREEETAAEHLVRWLLQVDWHISVSSTDEVFGSQISEMAALFALYFESGQGQAVLLGKYRALRQTAYRQASAWDLLLIDIAGALIELRVRASSWLTLPGFMNLSNSELASVIRKDGFPKELWPSQMLLGREGLFRGESGVIQMPTSAGKTRSVEIIVRGALMNRKVRLAIIVAPFRALCHEIATALRRAFRGEAVKVNELSDALQLDFLDEISEWFGTTSPSSQGLLVLTPEKLLYAVRQRPDLIKNIGLVVYDEGHQFDSTGRGITYELLLTSLKILLPEDTQTILISAVIKNAAAVGSWLIGADARIVNGAKLLPTSRSIAFASWQETLGQIAFYEGRDYEVHDYFVPRVISQVDLDKRPGERSQKVFPDRASEKVSKDVSLHLGLRLAGQGAVAIFCGRKDTASAIAERAAELHLRQYQVNWPAAHSNPQELARLLNLVQLHFGNDYFLARAAKLGIFVHHGNTPHGLRLCIEHAMQRELVRFVVCTSTLAQGVNLPIRYLIVSSTWQTGEQIKNRDFQNLMGRAGRAGMHTEGLVIFADPRTFDGKNQKQNSWRFRDSVSLLDPELAEDTTSALLALLSPFDFGKKRKQFVLEPRQLLDLFFSSQDKEREEWAARIEQEFAGEFKAKELMKELTARRKRLVAVESFLMSNRGTSSLGEYKIVVEAWARETLAYSLANESQKAALLALFERAADYVHSIEPSAERQAAFAKTLLGVDAARRIDVWVAKHRDILLSLQTSPEWLEFIWELFIEEVDDKFFHDVAPESFAREIVAAWLEGEAYRTLLVHCAATKPTKPHGESRRKLTDDDILEFLESTVGFRCSLVVAAVGQSLFGPLGLDGEDARAFNLFQKSLKYGLPDSLAISAFEAGFADREVASRLRDALLSAGYPHAYFGLALRESRFLLYETLKQFPSYFNEVLETL